MYVPLGGFITRLTNSISNKSTHLPIPSGDYDTLLHHLADGDYSFLEIRDGRAGEVVKVTNLCGKIVLERGADKTTNLGFRCGSAVLFVLTMQGVKDTICQMKECDNE